MKLNQLHNTPGAKHRRKRVGRGDSSGWGRTCGRGEKGQKSRTGSTIRPFFEGGQIPLFRRLPKRGFNHPTRTVFNIVNVGVLNELFQENETVDVKALAAKGIINKMDRPVKVLADGDIKKPLQVKAHKFSAAAKTKIAAAGGACELIRP